MDNDYELIEKYVLGELTEVERADFERAIQSDPSLAKSVEDHREMVRRLNALRLRNKVNTIVKEPYTPSKSKLFNFTWLTIAACISFLLGAYWYLNVYDKKPEEWIHHEEKKITPIDTTTLKNSTTPIAVEKDTSSPISKEKPTRKKLNPLQFVAMASSLLISPSEIFLRDIDLKSSSEKNDLHEATEAYTKKDYPLSLRHLQKISLDNQNEDFLILRAHNYFQMGKYARSAKDFEDLQNSFQYKHEAKWNFLLCQLALGKLEKVNLLLDNMISDMDFPFRDKAKDLKAKLAT